MRMPTELRDAFAPYVGVGRRVAGARTGRSSSTPWPRRQPAVSRAAPTGSVPATSGPGVEAQGLSVNVRGRIPATRVEQYEARS